MAWFLNFYRCAPCKRIWTDQWSCTCDDDCPHCGALLNAPASADGETNPCPECAGLVTLQVITTKQVIGGAIVLGVVSFLGALFGD